MKDETHSLLRSLMMTCHVKKITLLHVFPVVGLVVKSRSVDHALLHRPRLGMGLVVGTLQH